MNLINVKKILVIKLRYIGDVLLSTPVLANLRHQFPGAHITMVVNKGTDEVLKHNSNINSIIPIDRSRVKGRILGRILYSLRFVKEIRRERFDLVVDLTDGDRGALMSFLSGAPIRIGFNSNREIRGRLYTKIVHPSQPRLHNVEYQLEALKALGLSIETKRLELPWSEKEETFVDNWVTKHHLRNRPFVTIHSGARWWFKQWPLDRFSALAKKLKKQFDLESVFLGGDKELKELKEIQDNLKGQFIAASQLTLLQMAALIRRSKIFIGNDNGPMHVAAAVGTPVVALFGSSDPKIWGPWGEGHCVVYKGVSCSPCAHKGCDMGELNCMQQISVSDVLDQLEKIRAKGENGIRSSFVHP